MLAAKLCPSANSSMESPVVIGIVYDFQGKIRIGYLKASIVANAEILELAAPAKETEVFRLAAVCIKDRCAHQVDSKCSLISRVVDKLPVVSNSMPPCAIRSSCVWWNEAGMDACLRCPQVITTNYNPTANERVAAQAPCDLSFG